MISPMLQGLIQSMHFLFKKKKLISILYEVRITPWLLCYYGFHPETVPRIILYLLACHQRALKNIQEKFPTARDVFVK